MDPLFEECLADNKATSLSRVEEEVKDLFSASAKDASRTEERSSLEDKKKTLLKKLRSIRNHRGGRARASVSTNNAMIREKIRNKLKMIELRLSEIAEEERGANISSKNIFKHEL